MKLNVGVIFGGSNLEHEKGIITATSVMNNLNTDKYNIIPIYIDKHNVWYTGYHLKDIINFRDIALCKRYAKKVNLVPSGKNFILQTTNLFKRNVSYVDLVIPSGVGKYINDGSLEGYLDIIGIPYTGCKVLASAISKDKVIIKDLVRANNIPVCSYVWFYKDEFLNSKKKILEKVKPLKYPLYVKPANLGSSIGIHLVNNEEEFIKAVKNIIKYDEKVIAEEKIKNLKEVQVSVMGDNKSCEVTDIYEYVGKDDDNTKADEVLNKEYENYFKINVKTNITKPLLSKEMKDDIKTYAKDLFRLINAKGIIEIDFLIDENNMKLYFSKISTLPYHMASHIWKKNKVSESELLENMINIAINERNRNREFITHIDKNLLEGWDLKANKMK